MGGSGGGYSGSGSYSGGSSPSSGGGAGSGGDSGGGQDVCTINSDANLAGPVAAVISTLSVGNILPVVLNTSGAAPIAQVISNGAVAGTLAGLPRLRDLIQCMIDGVDYVFEVTLISGGRIGGRVRNA